MAPSGGLQSIPSNQISGVAHFSQLSTHLLIRHKRILNCVCVASFTQFLATSHQLPTLLIKLSIKYLIIHVKEWLRNLKENRCKYSWTEQRLEEEMTQIHLRWDRSNHVNWQLSVFSFYHPHILIPQEIHCQFTNSCAYPWAALDTAVGNWEEAFVSPAADDSLQWKEHLFLTGYLGVYLFSHVFS